MAFFECPGAVVTWDEDFKCVELRFRGYIEGEALRKACLSMLELLDSKRGTRLLTDSRELKVLKQDDQRWIDVEWQQRARLTDLAYNAVVLPKSAIGQLSVAAVVKKIPSKLFEIVHFSSIDDAREWLRSK